MPVVSFGRPQFLTSALVLALAGLALVVFAIGAAPSKAGLAAGQVHFPSRCTNERVKPRHIIVACGDAQSFLTKLHWARWGGQRARGRGKYHENDCDPSCVDGHFHRYPAHVHLSRPSFCTAPGVSQFHRLVVTIPRSAIGPRHRRVRFPCPS